MGTRNVIKSEEVSSRHIFGTLLSSCLIKTRAFNEISKAENAFNFLSDQWKQRNKSLNKLKAIFPKYHYVTAVYKWTSLVEVL